MTLYFVVVSHCCDFVIFAIFVFQIFLIFVIFLPWPFLGVCRLSPDSSACDIVRQGVMEGIDTAINCSKQDRALVAEGGWVGSTR